MKRTIATLCTALLAVPVALSAGAASAQDAGTTTAAATDVVTAAASTSRLVPLAPTRLLDTRTGVGAPVGLLAPGATVDLTVNGVQGVPADATAVVLNVTITDAVGAGYVQVVPKDGAALGSSSNLNVETAGQTIPNLVIAPIGANGQVTLYAQAGGNLVADALGAFVPADTSTVGRYQALVPTRILDTRSGVGAPAAKPGPQGTVRLQVTGAGGVPATGVSAVALNVTATEATAQGYVQVVPTNGPTGLGASSNLNAAAGQTIANLVIVPVGADGSVTLYTQSGTHLLADVTGWFTDAAAADTAVGLFTPVAPDRLLDTRGGTRPAANSNTALSPGGSAGVPSAGVAAVALNVTATVTAAAGFVQAYPAGTLQQGQSSTLNVERSGQTIPNAAIATLGAGGLVNLYVQSGTHLLADVSGWFSAGFTLDPGNDPDPGGGEVPPPPVDPTGPVAALSLPTTVPGLSPRLVFSTQAEAPKVLNATVTNTGGQPLVVTVPPTDAIVGTNAGSFAVTPGAYTVAPGASQQVPVTFAPPGANLRTKHHAAALTMTTNDPAHASLRVVLRGLDAEGFEGVNEPWLADVTRALGYGGINVGWTGLEVPADNTDPANPVPQTGVPLYGDQVPARTFRRADPSQPVALIPLGSYTARHVVDVNGDPDLGVVRQKNPSGPQATLFTFAADTPSSYVQNQKLLPAQDGSTTFVPASATFALTVEGDDSSINTPTCVAIRTYPAKISATNILPNTFVVAADLTCLNGDYNDYVFLIANVRPIA